MWVGLVCSWTVSLSLCVCVCVCDFVILCVDTWVCDDKPLWHPSLSLRSLTSLPCGIACWMQTCHHSNTIISSCSTATAYVCVWMCECEWCDVWTFLTRSHSIQPAGAPVHYIQVFTRAPLSSVSWRDPPSKDILRALKQKYTSICWTRTERKIDSEINMW